MTSTISVRMEEPTLKDLSQIEKKWQTDRSEVIRRLLFKAIHHWKIEDALEQIAAHRISVGKAAEDCSLTIWEMLDLCKEKNIDWTGYSEDELLQDLQQLK